MGKYYEKILTKNLAPALGTLGMGRLTGPVYSGRGHILMFHRIIPLISKDRIHNHLSLEVSPAQLEQVILYFRKKDYDFINLDGLSGWLIQNKNSGRKFVIFTFDDGYKDNLDFAYPVLKKNKVPFTLYITNSFPDQKAIIWWYILEDLILKNSNIHHSFSHDEISLTCTTQRQKELAFSRIRNIIAGFDERNREQELTGFFSRYGMDTEKYNRELALTWDEISQLSTDSLAEIGAHTLNHYNLCELSDEQARIEIEDSKRDIESKIKKQVSHFCYPLGRYGLREEEIVRNCGYATATTTKTGNIFYPHLEHLYALPRITINVLTTKKILDLQTRGFFAAVLNKFKRTIY